MKGLLNEVNIIDNDIVNVNSIAYLVYIFIVNSRVKDIDEVNDRQADASLAQAPPVGKVQTLRVILPAPPVLCPTNFCPNP